MKARNSRKSDDVVRVSVSFKGSDYAEIQSIAKAKKVSVAWVVRDAVSAYLEARAPLFRRSSTAEKRL